MGVVSRRRVCGSGWNLLVWLVGVVVRRYIDFLILLIPTPLVFVLFCSSISTFCSFFLMFIVLVYMYVPQFGNMCNLEIALCKLRNLKIVYQSRNCAVKQCNVMIA